MDKQCRLGAVLLVSLLFTIQSESFGCITTLQNQIFHLRKIWVKHGVITCSAQICFIPLQGKNINIDHKAFHVVASICNCYWNLIQFTNFSIIKYADAYRNFVNVTKFQYAHAYSRTGNHALGQLRQLFQMLQFWESLRYFTYRAVCWASSVQDGTLVVNRVRLTKCHLRFKRSEVKWWILCQQAVGGSVWVTKILSGIFTGAILICLAVLSTDQVLYKVVVDRENGR